MAAKKEVFIGSDHAGFKLKEAIKQYLKSLGYEVMDLGALTYSKGDDYPDYGSKVAKEVVKKRAKDAKGILFCGSSQGMCIVANKIKGARAVSVNSEKDARSSRTDDDANILCMSGWNTPPPLAKKIAKTWLNTKFSKAARHNRRLNKIKRIENSTMR